MIILGVDPGLSGAIAILDGKRITVLPMPIYRVGRKRVYDIAEITDLFIAAHPDLVAIEAITRPGSLVGNGAFMHGVAMAMGVEVVRPRPQVWKAHFGLAANKAESIDLCHKLYPQTKSIITKKGQDGMAEAILIARYALETSKGGSDD